MCSDVPGPQPMPSWTTVRLEPRRAFRREATGTPTRRPVANWLRGALFFPPRSRWIHRVTRTGNPPRQAGYLYGTGQTALNHNAFRQAELSVSGGTRGGVMGAIEFTDRGTATRGRQETRTLAQAAVAALPAP